MTMVLNVYGEMVLDQNPAVVEVGLLCNNLLILYCDQVIVVFTI